MQGQDEKDVTSKYILGTVKSMARYDSVRLPFGFEEKLKLLLKDMPQGDFDGCMDEADPNV
jgi:hypothetical protein